MKRYRAASWIAGLTVVFLVLNVFGDWVSWADVKSAVKQAAEPSAQALSQFTPTGGSMITGTTLSPITSAAASGNVGSWKGTLASDNYYWTASSTASGLDQQTYLDGSTLNNANDMIITMETGSNNTTLQRYYQICDWSSSTGVDNAADAQCTTGGWRTLNVRYVPATTAADTTYTWHIYNGYWSTTPTSTSNVALSTPLSNFIRGSDGRIAIRSFSPTNCTTCTHLIDYVRVDSVVDPIYGPAGMATNTAATVTNNYRNAVNALWSGQSGSDNQYAQVAGTASVTADFYFTFSNVRTYPGANSILVRAEYSCTTTGLNHRPEIYNFNSASWEDLSTSSIACSATDATSAFTKSNVTISNYISSGQMRIGWKGLSNSTVGIRIDTIYAIVGSVNNDTSQCEIGYGTGTATNCQYTRDLDTTIASPATWQATTEADSATFGHAFYPGDTDQDATAAEHAWSMNMWVPASVATNTRVTGIIYATDWRSNTTTITTQAQLKDMTGGNATVSGGWTAYGTTNAAATYTYEDSVTNGYFGSNPDDYLDTTNSRLNVRIRTSATTAAASVVGDIDFVFASVQWAETSPTRYTLRNTFVPENGTLVTGTNTTITSAATTGNVGSWKGTLASDNFYWTVTAATTGLDQELFMDNVQQNNANQLLITFEAGSSNTTLQRYYQICDWSSSSTVDNAADANCTGGGWRTMNVRDVPATTAADTSYTWQIYDGYWNTSATSTSNTPLSTPVSNFIKTSNGRVLVRAFSPTNCNTCTHSIDYLKVSPMINSLYSPSALTTSTAGTVTNNYRNAVNALNTGQTGSDNQYAQVAGTASITPDFYFTFNNVKTYPSMNAILVRAEHSCTTTGLNYRPKIWNFTSSAWEDLSTSSIACSTTDATNTFTKSSITVTDYISNNSMRVGWYGLSNSTVGIRIDMEYIMLGSVNSDNTKCEISFGTGTATNCQYTRDLDTTIATPATWQQTTEAESATFGHDYYGQDNDGDATSAEHAASANLWINASIPNNAQGIGRIYALDWRSNATTITTAGQFKDLTGANATVSGGWTQFGTTNLATTYTYEDSMTNGYFTSNPEDYVDTYNGRVNVRVRTTASTAVAAVTRDIDYVFTSLQWVEAPSVTGSITLTMDTSTIAFGNLTPGTPIFATTTAAVTVANLTNGYQLTFGNNAVTSTLGHSDGVNTLPDYTDWSSSGSGNATSSPGNTFSFRVSTSTANFNSTWWGSGTPLFAGIPLTDDTIMNCTTCNSGNTTTSINYRLNAPTNQKTGSYTGTSTVTALTNP